MPMADQRRDPTSDPRRKPCSRRPGGRRAASASSRSSSARRPASARPTRCCRPARARRKDGYDIVVGVVETHGRKETEALLEGLEVVPRRRIEYKGQWLEEMDLDAIIARRPQIVLVDELAHTNAPGSRHPKRYLDVEELLSRGIDVYTHRQHPAHRKPERRRRADHARARARDRAGFDLRSRRCRRAGRSHARRPDPAAQGRQGLRPEAGRAGAGALLLARQPDGAARAGAAAHRRARRRAAAHADAGARHSRALGGGRAHSGLRQRGPARRRPRALRQAAGRPAAWAVDGALRREPAQPAAAARSSATASPTRCGWRKRSAARRSPSRAATGASPTT